MRSSIRVVGVVGVAALVLPIGCEPSGQREDWFVDAGPELGLLFDHTSGVEGEFLMPEAMGSGLALFDYDDDGDLDVYFVNADAETDPALATGNRLFRQDADGVFRDATTEAGVGDTGYGMGTALGDIDNDGDRDLLVTNDGPNRLYRNNADGTFSDITESAGIEGSRWSTSAAFCDIDDDGFLDLYIANYVTNETALRLRERHGRAGLLRSEHLSRSPRPPVPQHGWHVRRHQRAERHRANGPQRPRRRLFRLRRRRQGRLPGRQRRRTQSALDEPGRG